MKEALIGDIGRYRVHDGPGIRTTVFFKGCPLRCPWCHNPEFTASRPEIVFHAERCIGCGDCRDICPEQAVTLDKIARIHRSRCTACGLCTADCPTGAVELAGRKYDVDELTAILLRDSLFYESSGGGVTVSGGEPTAQLDFCGELLQRLRAEGVHTCMETNGFFAWDEFKATCLPYLDLILFDVKIADPQKHRQITGVDNRVILANLTKLLAERAELVLPRIPLIPGFTADSDNIGRLAALFHQLQVRRCSLLPYHPFGLGKAEKIGRKPNSLLPQKPMDKKTLQSWQRFFDDIEVVAP